MSHYARMAVMPQSLDPRRTSAPDDYGSRLSRLAPAWQNAVRRAQRRWMLASPVPLLLIGAVLTGHIALPAAITGLVLVVATIMVWPAAPADDESPGSLSQPLTDAGPPGQGPADPGAANGWRTVIDALPEPAMVLDANGVIVHHNGLVRDIFPNVRRGHPISYVSRDPDLNEAVEQSVRASDRIVVQLHHRVPLERRISATLTRLAEPQGAGAQTAGTLPMLLITFRDLTEQDKLAQMRADFIANASHELRTPLASLRGFVETLQGPARDDAAARDRFLGIMASQAARMTRLIDDLLSLSRVEMRVHLPPKGIVEINEVAGYVVQALEPLADASGITLSVDRLSAPARIRGDREEIVQVLQNLVHNGIKYGRQGGFVALTIKREAARNPASARLIVAVSDDGPGIAQEHLPRLTERFYRINVSSSREKGGTGLGLAIVKHIVMRHRGDLRIESRLGHGSTFTVLFSELGGDRHDNRT